MKIRWENNQTEMILFEDICPGECFRWDGKVCVKGDCDYDAIVLTTGELLCNMEGEMVEVLDAEVVIK